MVTYMPIYLYDLLASNHKTYNRSKRMFYYYLNQLITNEVKFITKSTLLVPRNLESNFDEFFNKWKNKIIVYKIYSEEVSKIV